MDNENIQSSKLLDVNEKTGFPHLDKPWLKYYDKDFLEKPLPEMTIVDYIKSQNKSNEDLPAITFFGNQVSYSELYGKIDEASRVLSELGVQDGDRIMYMMPNIPETAYLMYGTSQLGAVADYIDPRPDSVDLNISAKKVFDLFHGENAKYLVALDQCYLGMIRPIENELKELGVENVVVVSASDSMNLKSKLNYLNEVRQFNGFKNMIESAKKTQKFAKMLEEATKTSKLQILRYPELVKECQNSTFKLAEYQPGKLTVITHTSGTSSPRPKPMPLTNDNLNIYAHQTFGANMPMNLGDNVLHMLPYFAAFGLVDVVHAGFAHGNNLIQIPEFAPANLGKMIVKYKPQTIIGPPTWFLNLINDPVLKDADLSFLTMVTYGGDAMDANDEIKINKFLHDHNCKTYLTKGHGMSETCGCGSFSTGEYSDLNSMGIPLPHVVYGVVDPDTKEPLKFEDGKDEIEGEFIISSGTVTPGVLDDNVIVPHYTYDGMDFIRTKDIGTMNKDGVMKFLSRSDRSFTRYDGFKVKPYEIEDVIKSDPLVKYCVVSPYYVDDKFGYMPLANIVLEDDVEMSAEEQIAYVENLVESLFVKNAAVSTRQIPSKFRFRDSLPLTPNGKVNYNALSAEEITGEEIGVELEETNISVGEIKVIPPVKAKQKVLKI